MKAFVEAYKKKTGYLPDIYATHYYDATGMLIHIMKKVGVDRDKIRDSFRDTTYEGIIGAYKADEEGNLWHNAVVMEFLPEGKIKSCVSTSSDRPEDHHLSQSLASGLLMGCIYALVGLGFILIYNATGGLNFAQGELVMLAAFVFYSMIGTGAPYAAAALITIVLMGLAGFAFQRLTFYPLRDRSFLAFIIATIGFSIFARNLALLVWGPYPLKVPSFFATDVVSIGNVVLAPEHLFIVAVTIVVLITQYALFFYTDLGRRLRATAQNAEVAQLMGIRAGQMIAITFMFSTLLTGVAGVLLAPIFLVDTEMGLNLILKAFIAVIIGGFGSVPGAVVGGIIVGLLEILIAVFISSVYKDAIVFGLLILLLIAFPQGIFGERISERA